MFCIQGIATQMQANSCTQTQPEQPWQSQMDILYKQMHEEKQRQQEKEKRERRVQNQ